MGTAGTPVSSHCNGPRRPKRFWQTELRTPDPRDPRCLQGECLASGSSCEMRLDENVPLLSPVPGPCLVLSSSIPALMLTVQACRGQGERAGLVVCAPGRGGRGGGRWPGQGEELPEYVRPSGWEAGHSGHGEGALSHCARAPAPSQRTARRQKALLGLGGRGAELAEGGGSPTLQRGGAKQLKPLLSRGKADSTSLTQAERKKTESTEILHSVC